MKKHKYRIRPIPGFAGHFADSNGEIWRDDPVIGMVQMKQYHNRYKQLRIKGAYCRVHRLVAMAFHGLPPDGATMCRHLNDKKHDNRPENLAWGTHPDNIKDKVRNTGFWRSVDSRTSTPEMRALLERLIREGYIYRSIAEMTCLSLRAVKRFRSKVCPDVWVAKGRSPSGRRYA